ncbi:RNA polymerase sigma-70 factor, ECF subfamily [Mucilaginibacter sp. OK268]|jgi:RNA polymerase sigma-70 factor (ECF subfamily)|uniref:RNA polymerase sigma factor n=1 Tax=Mucilaginibacter sp. OK268 TaxID=1881048 RepID=UPI00088F1309|nr:sigma-70 family RNA polymerase sigma factor [Mucilaginibacter sp. OK268]SDP75904.1 RNA polymerase sigma-70 factor, ECF subfamily [Mucilaginibacter sp. OK268]
MGEAELQQLIADCLQQNRTDQKVLYRAFYGFAMSICLRYAGNRYEAAEIMNQGFLKVFTNLHKYDTGHPFIAWVGRIMMNTSVDYYKNNLKLPLNDDLDAAEDIGHDELTNQKLNYDDLLSMIQQLPNAYRTVFNLFAIEGFSYEEIAAQLGISTGTSKSNLFKAREKLKTMVLNSGRLPDDGSEDIRRKIITIGTFSLGLSQLIELIMR